MAVNLYAAWLPLIQMLYDYWHLKILKRHEFLRYKIGKTLLALLFWAFLFQAWG